VCVSVYLNSSWLHVAVLGYLPYLLCVLTLFGIPELSCHIHVNNIPALYQSERLEHKAKIPTLDYSANTGSVSIIAVEYSRLRRLGGYQS